MSVAAAAAAAAKLMRAVFNTLPWKIPVKRGLAFVVNPLSLLFAPPSTLPPAWAGRPQWKYTGGLGVMTVLQYENTPVGPYSELILTVGPYKSGCKARAPNSIVRIWVDSSATCDAAHRIWGIPKQLARFEWREANGTAFTPGLLGIEVTDVDSGEVLFDATAKDTFVSLNWLKTLLPKTRQTVHWPIDANQHRHVPVGTVPAYRMSEAALAQGKALTTVMHVDYSGGLINYLSSVSVNQLAMTGHTNQRFGLGLLPVGVSFKSGTANPVWAISEPAVC
jgi:hypothetical protein